MPKLFDLCFFVLFCQTVGMPYVDDKPTMSDFWQKQGNSVDQNEVKVSLSEDVINRMGFHMKKKIPSDNSVHHEPMLTNFIDAPKKSKLDKDELNEKSAVSTDTPEITKSDKNELIHNSGHQETMKSDVSMERSNMPKVQSKEDKPIVQEVNIKADNFIVNQKNNYNPEIPDFWQVIKKTDWGIIGTAVEWIYSTSCKAANYVAGWFQ